MKLRVCKLIELEFRKVITVLISKFQNNNAEARVCELEKEYNILLPPQYRNFLCKYNGGETPNTDFKGGRTSTSVRAFYGFGEVDYSIDKMDLRQWIGNRVFPIACDMFGNEFVISFDEVDYGNVYFANHEKGYRKTFVGTDFKDFVNKCKSKEINPYARRSIAEREADLIARGKGENISDGLRKMWQDEIDKYGNMVQEKVSIDG